MRHHATPSYIIKPLLSAVLLALPALAAHAAGTTPNAGSVLQEVKPAVPASPSSNDTGLKIEREGLSNLPITAPFLVNQIQIIGNTVFDTATLHSLVADAEGKELSLPQLDAVAARISDYYRSHGYPLARAVIPVQTIKGGAVRTVVIEAKYDKVSVDNRSAVNTSLLEGTLATVKSGQPIAQGDLDHALLLLSDIPGTTIAATLRPGSEVGTSDLLVSADAKPSVNGRVTLDDYGTKVTGKFRVGGTISFMNPLHLGDVLSVSALSSGRGVNFGRLDYEALLSGFGTRAGASLSSLRYKLGDKFENLGAHGTATESSLWVKHPFVRSRSLNLYGQAQYDYKALRDEIDNAPIVPSERNLGNLTVSVSGDAQDWVMAGSAVTWNFGLTSGKLNFENAAAQSADLATAKTQDGFAKLATNLSFQQRITSADNLYFAFSSQWANSNLDASEKLVVGGPYSVRAYDTGAVSGDTGFVGTGEWRHDLGAIGNGMWQAVAFADAAHVTVNKTPWSSGYNTAKLGGVGLGLNWAATDIWSAKLFIAKSVGAVPAILGETPSFRVWGQMSTRF